MSPTIYRKGNKRFFFFSREEFRMHVHVSALNGEAKYWLEPTVALADFAGFSSRELNSIQKVVEEHKNEFIKAWKKYFKS